MEKVCVGLCDYCSSPEEDLLESEQLQSYFDPFMDIYEQSTGTGLLLSEWLRSDWGLFKDMPLEASRQLVVDVFNDPSLSTKTFSVKAGSGSDVAALWDEFRESIKHSNRFFAKKLDQLEEALQLLESLQVPDLLYRARIQTADSSYLRAQMGAPPRDICGNGRANPAGIPYLYLASHENVAISEVRPSPGDKVTVATFAKPSRSLSLVDLRQPKFQVSPFSGDHPLHKLRAHLSLLEKLGQELSTPIVPRLAQLEYLPSQYLCELIKNLGFDGVVYNSSLSNVGWNYAIFDPSGFDAVECRSVLVSGITVNSQPLPVATPETELVLS